MRTPIRHADGVAAPVRCSRRSLVRGVASGALVTLAAPNARATAPVAPAWTMREARTTDLVISYAELGPAHGPATILLHGWPYDIHAFADVAPRLANAGRRVIVPHLRGFGATRFVSGATPRNAQQSVLAADVVALMDTLDVPKAVIGGFDWGARTANIVAALWPERCEALVSVSGYLIGSQQAGRAPLSPEAEQSWWYQFYFATERGRRGYEANRDTFARLIWRTASPRWAFDDATFARSAAALHNPDHVAITVHNYRWRLGLAQGEPRFDALEARLAHQPDITVPTITLEGDANGAPHPNVATYAHRFKGPYRHRLLAGGIGHNLPQEAPEAFAQALLDASSLTSATGGWSNSPAHRATAAGCRRVSRPKTLASKPR